MDPKFKPGDAIWVEVRVTAPGTNKIIKYEGTILSLEDADLNKNGSVAMYYYKVEWTSPNGTQMTNMFPEKLLSRRVATGGRRRRYHKTKRARRGRRSRKN